MHLSIEMHYPITHKNKIPFKLLISQNKPHFSAVSCRLLTRNCVPEFDDLVLLIKNHFTKDEPQETHLLPDNPWITNKKDTRPRTMNTWAK